MLLRFWFREALVYRGTWNIMDAHRRRPDGFAYQAALLIERLFLA